MRILVLNAFSKKVGGAEVYMHRLIEALRGRGHRVGLFAGDPDEEVDEAELRVVRRPEWDPATLVSDPVFSAALVGMIERFRPDVLHVHNLHHVPVDTVLHVGASGIPAVQTVHDFGIFCPNSWCVVPDGRVCEGGPGKKCFERGCEAHYPYDARVVFASKLRYEWTRSSLRSFVAPSAFLADKLAAHGFGPVEVVPYFAEPAPAPTRSSAANGAPSAPRERKWAIFVGRLVPEKGVEYLIRAWPKVVERHRDARLSIVGDGPDRERLEGIARGLGLDPTVLFTGRIDNSEVHSWMSRSTCQVIPSIWCENSPIAIYESYFAALPMVASDIAGLPSLVVEGETGLLAKPRDAADLAAKLVRLLDDPALQARLQAGCRAAVTRYARETHIDRMVEIFEDAIRRQGGQAPRPYDADMVESMHRMYLQLHGVERWAGDMQKHIRYLETKGEAGEPVQNLRRHLKYLIKARRAAR
jgi:glycosyltransferase involved in cell wall biosynthesis